MSTSTYELKYLKYKNKYLNLKKILNEQSGSGGDKCIEEWYGPHPQTKCGGLLSSCKELKILGDLHLCMNTSHPVIKQMITIYPTFLKITDFNWNIRKHFLKELIKDNFYIDSIFKMGFYLKEVYDLLDKQTYKMEDLFETYSKISQRTLGVQGTIDKIFSLNEELKKLNSKDAPKPFTYKELIQLGLSNEIFNFHSSKKIIFNKEEASINDFLDQNYCKTKYCTSTANCDVYCPYYKFINLGYTLDECLASNMTIRGYSGLKDLKQLLKKFTMKEILTLDWNDNRIAQNFTLREILEGIHINIIDTGYPDDTHTHSIGLLEKMIYDPFYGNNIINVYGIDVSDGFKKVFDEIKSLKTAEERLNIYTGIFALNRFKKYVHAIVAAKILEIDNKMFLNKVNNSLLGDILESPILKNYFFNDETKEIFINRGRPIPIVKSNLMSFKEAVQRYFDTGKISFFDLYNFWRGEKITNNVLRDAGFNRDKLRKAGLTSRWITELGFPESW